MDGLAPKNRKGEKAAAAKAGKSPPVAGRAGAGAARGKPGQGSRRLSDERPRPAPPGAAVAGRPGAANGPEGDPVTAALAGWQERWPAGKRYLVAVSGGLDSTVLLRGLVRRGWRNLVVCHLDHTLRGRASTAEARRVERLTAELGLKFEGGKAEVRAEAVAAGISLETAGRAARHRFFAETARKHRCRRIVLAHHADDQAETVLMNLCRGSAGLAGMSGETELSVPGFRAPLVLLRPLLEIPKRALAEMAARHGWDFAEDASNAVPEVTRNRVRLEVLPLLAEVFRRDPAPALARAAAWTEGARAYFEEAAAPWTGREALPVAEVAALPEMVRRAVLTGWLRERGVPDVSAALVRTALAMLDPASGPPRWNVPGNRWLRRRAGWLRLECVPACGRARR